MRLGLFLAGALLVYAQDAANFAAGEALYMGACSGCHGKTGEGSQGPSLLSGRASRLSREALVRTIRDGLPGTAMPNFPLAPDKLDQLAGFVRSLTAPAAGMATPGNAARGRAIFFGAGRCSGCHMLRGEGGYPGPDLSDIAAARTLGQLRESLRKPSERIAEGYGAATAVTGAGVQVTGVARDANNYTVHLVDHQGRLHRFQRSSLRSLDLPGQSLMPPVPEAMVEDLVAFLSRQYVRPLEGSKP